MNNVKRIIAAGLVGTAVISTGVVASAKTYGEDYAEAVSKSSIPDSIKTEMGKYLADNKLDKTQADDLKYYMGEVRKILGDRSSMAELSKLTDAEQGELTSNGTNALAVVGLVPKPYKSEKRVEIWTQGRNGQKILDLSFDDAKALGQVKQEELDSILDKAVAMTQNGADTVIPGTETSSTGTPSGKDDDKDKKEELNKKLDAIEAPENWTAEQKEAFNNAKDALKKLINNYSDDDFEAAKALIEALPDGPEKDKLLNLLKEIKPSKNPDSTNENPGSPNGPTGNSSNPGKTAKTATNFGNVAVAGLGLMTVAGTVFVISKKKIQ